MIRLLEYIKLSLELVFKWYMIGFAVFLLIVFILILCSLLSPNNTKFQYNAKFGLMYFATIMGCALFIPFYMLRPRNVINFRLTAWFLRKLSYVMGITIELRGQNYASLDIGGVLCGNHQSSLDVLILLNLFEVFGKISAIAKNQLFYVFPFGIAAWLAGLVFINRSSPKSAYKKLDDCGKIMKEKNVKLVIYPEGTRNRSRQVGLLPFKKGAFITAIKAQIPIIPLITSPYYFHDSKKKFLGKGHVIVSCLKPILTVGLKIEDANSLAERTRTIMLEEYQKLCKEVDENSMLWSKIKRPRLTLIKEE